MRTTNHRTNLGRVLAGLVVSAAATGALLAVTAAPAAAATTPSVSVNASPEPLYVSLHSDGTRTGASVKVAGKVGSTSSTSRNAGRVKFYFRNYKSTSFVYMGYTTSSAAGYYARYFTQKYSGEWKVKFLGNSYRNAAWSPGDFVEALAKKYVNRTVFSADGSGDYTGGPVTLPNTGPLTTSIALSCDSYAPYISVSWNGYLDFDYIWYEPPTGVGATAQYMYPTTRYGHVDVSSQSSCYWAVDITQRVLTYVRV